jgi:D-alanyl-D-alanine carboxypeptidase/D-alanyl-D-alanine-endopeptidase (penicillin-binding protein 4)
MKNIFLLSFCFLLSCSPGLQKQLTKQVKQAEQELQHHIGIYITEPATGKTVFEWKADKYFTPASNTKVLTFYTCLQVLGDSLPAIRYRENNDSLIFQGMADPSFLNPFVYTNANVFNFLKNHEKPLYFATSATQPQRYGTGWAWDDYPGNYQPERSAFPLYSNLVTVRFSNNVFTIIPPSFTPFVTIGENKKYLEANRSETINRFTVHAPSNGLKSQTEIPFIVNDTTIHQLLQDTLLRKITPVAYSLSRSDKVLFSTPTDSVLKVMMQESDNFLAEQLLLQCALILTDSLTEDAAIRFMQRNYFADIPDALIWKDGSGLSRYNLVTPRSMVNVWIKIVAKRSIPTLLPLLATGGKNGTIANWYKADTPYIFGKTGTLANNHSLSGLLFTKSGKMLVFSYMNSHYPGTATQVRKQMQQIFEYLRNKY